MDGFFFSPVMDVLLKESLHYYYIHYNILSILIGYNQSIILLIIHSQLFDNSLRYISLSLCFACKGGGATIFVHIFCLYDSSIYRENRKFYHLRVLVITWNLDIGEKYKLHRFGNLLLHKSFIKYSYFEFFEKQRVVKIKML